MRFEEEIGPNDLKDHRIFITDTNKIHLKREGPYGYWYINMDKGPSPKEFDGAFVTFDDAKKAATLFLKSRDKPLLEEVLTVSDAETV